MHLPIHTEITNPSAVNKPIKPIKSFVRRCGRIGVSQKKKLIELWAQYGIGELYLNNQKFSGKYNNLADLFLSQPQKTILEIGFGSGDSLFQMASENSDIRYIGVEVHLTGVSRLLNNIKKTQLKNLYLIAQDAQVLLTDSIPDQVLSGVQIFFPDPWHKTRHHKRRLIQIEFLILLAKKLKSGGFVHIATDWQDYANHIQNALEQSNVFKLQNYKSLIPVRPKTKYELRGERLGHVIYDFYYYT